MLTVVVFVCVRCSMLMDEVLYSIADDVKNFGVIYLVDITEVSDFSSMCATHSLFGIVCTSFPLNLWCSNQAQTRVVRVSLLQV